MAVRASTTTITTPVSPESVKVVCISDTHNEQPLVPLGDILIHAGDLTVNGTFSELQAQLPWLTNPTSAETLASPVQTIMRRN
jgi:predicted phosphodiesterase